MKLRRKNDFKKKLRTSKAAPSSPTVNFHILTSAGCPQFACAKQINIMNETTATLWHVTFICLMAINSLNWLTFCEMLLKNYSKYN